MSTFIPRSLERDLAIPLLTLQDVAIRGFASEWPAPRWIKVWKDGEPAPVMAWMNGAFARWFDIDPRVYMGQEDSAVWPDEAVRQFRASDEAAIARAGEIVLSTEDTGHGIVIARKFAFRINDGITGWGIYGEVCPLEVMPCNLCPQKEKNNG